MIYLDANFFLFAILDITEKGKSARTIQDSIIKGKQYAVTSALTLDEIMWVLIKNKKRHLVRTVIEGLYSMPNLEISSVSSTLPLLALDMMEEYALSPRDAFHLATMRASKIRSIVTDDDDFDRVKGITRIRI
jgi:predicted nucleic acid-binding protein